MATYLGLDIGTSSVKALLIDGAQRIVGVGNAPLEVSRPHPLWSEQNPEDWWQGTLAAIAEPGGCCARRSCGTTGAAAPNARKCTGGCPT